VKGVHCGPRTPQDEERVWRRAGHHHSNISDLYPRIETFKVTDLLCIPGKNSFSWLNENPLKCRGFNK